MGPVDDDDEDGAWEDDDDDDEDDMVDPDYWDERGCVEDD